MAHEDRHPTDLQQRQAKMPAAGATQALRLCRKRWLQYAWALKNGCGAKKCEFKKITNTIS